MTTGNNKARRATNTTGQDAELRSLPAMPMIQDASDSMETTIKFLDDLDALGVAFISLRAGDDEGYPARWSTFTPATNRRERERGLKNHGICGLFGGRVAVIDIDTKNGADTQTVRGSLAEAGVSVYAEVQSPSGGWHFYVSAPVGMKTLHANEKRASLDLPAVEVIASGGNTYLPGTKRVKYHGKGYTIVHNNLDALLADDGTAFAAWVAQHTTKAVQKAVVKTTQTYAPSIDGLAPYVAAALKSELESVASAGEGSRNDQLNTSSFLIGTFVGAGAINREDAYNELLDAALTSGLDHKESEDTINSGLAAGQLNPRDIPEQDYADILSLFPELKEEDATAIEDMVFDATPILQRIRQAAHHRMVVPWAVLGAVLARVMAEVPPHIVLPPLVGSDASLNLAVGLVAESGGGKSGAMGCATDVVKIPNRYAQDIGAGSGEAIAMSFLDWDKDNKVNVLKTYPYSLLTADEIAQVGMVGARTSQATMTPIMRSMLTGGAVANSSVEKERVRKLAPNSYRLCVVAGIQPKLSDVLLNDTDGGTPQRWLWLPADDPNWNVPETAWPGSVSWTLPLFGGGDLDGKVRLKVPEELKKAVYEARVRKLRREGDALDGHKLLTREKVAAALAILHGDTEITSSWWELAGHVMHRSDVTRAYCQREMSTKLVSESVAKGRLDVARETGAREARTGEIMKHAMAVWRTVSNGAHLNAKHTPEEGCTCRCVAFALRHYKGADKDAAIELALDHDWVEWRDDRLFPGQRKPSERAA